MLLYEKLEKKKKKKTHGHTAPQITQKRISRIHQKSRVSAGHQQRPQQHQDEDHVAS